MKLLMTLAPRSLPEADTTLSAQMLRPEFREAFLELARQKLATLREDSGWLVDKDRQMMALRTLDAILSAFDSTIRDAVGGFYRDAKVNTNIAREAEIIRRLDKLEEVIEKAAKNHYKEKISKDVQAPAGSLKGTGSNAPSGPRQGFLMYAQWKTVGGDVLPSYWVDGKNRLEALEAALKLKERKAVSVTIWNVDGEVVGSGTASPEGYWITRDPPTLAILERQRTGPPLMEKNLTRFQLRLRVGALVVWSLGAFAGCRSTLQNSSRSVHVSASSRQGSYRRRPPGGKQADDAENNKTLWKRCLIFIGWAVSSGCFVRYTFFEKEKEKD